MLDLEASSWSEEEYTDIITVLSNIAAIVYSTDSYWDCEVKAAYMGIEKLIKEHIKPLNVKDEDENHE